MKYSQSIWRLIHSVKSMVKISSTYVAFLENMNFTVKFRYSEKGKKNLKKISHFVLTLISKFE